MTLERSAAKAPRDFLFAVLGGCSVIGLLALAARPAIETAAPAQIAVAPTAQIAAPVYVTVPEPPPPAPVFEEIVEAGQTPQVRPQCVLDQSGDAPYCGSPDGFPAISTDGKTIISKHYPDDASRGYPGLYIQFIDVATSNVTRSVKILDPDEYDEETNKHAALVNKRARAMQRELEDKSFRPLISLTEGADRSMLVEEDGEQMRIVDPETKKLLYKTTFSAKQEYGQTEPTHEDDMCGGVDMLPGFVAWWDAKTRTLLAAVTYAFGPSCHCGSETKLYVRKVGS